MTEADAARVIELLELIERHCWWTYMGLACIAAIQILRMTLK